MWLLIVILANGDPQPIGQFKTENACIWAARAVTDADFKCIDTRTGTVSDNWPDGLPK